MLLHLEKLGNGIFLKYIINTSQIKVNELKVYGRAKVDGH